ncbi:Calcineurin-like phosphoesterase [Candidatus Tiddalikarchaeum anstoanum]|nr:Calcineurin-like phosphoesterase [Candidatus Tiddalikarchaeum anstoanum]
MIKETIIPNSGALLVKDGEESILVISDLHFEDNEYVYTIIEMVKRLVKKYTPTSVIVLGDVFNLGQGGVSVEAFDREISKIIPLSITAGNHDFEIFPQMILSDNYAFMHGDTDHCENERTNIVLGHTHPYLKGKRVFLKGVLTDGRNFIILPVFNDKVGGPDIIAEKDMLLGFVFQNDLIKTCDVYDLEGKKIGKYK